VFDWNRTDPATGTKRDLHVEQAIQCIDFEGRAAALDRSARRLASQPIAPSDIRKWKLGEVRDAAPFGQFAIGLLSHWTSLLCQSQPYTRRKFFFYPRI
jgi:hypothetical protein